jgi:hypothetical protein
MGEKVAYCTCHIFETISVTPTFSCFYYEHTINFTTGTLQQIPISRTITDNRLKNCELITLRELITLAVPRFEHYYIFVLFCDIKNNAVPFLTIYLGGQLPPRERISPPQ